MNYKIVLILSILCATSFLSHGMETKPTQEAIDEANSRLLQAVDMGDIAKVKRLIKEGVADLNTRDYMALTPLMHASMNSSSPNYTNIALMLIEAGANVNIVNDSLAAIYLAADNNLEVVNALIKAGADVNIVGDCTLSVAVHRGDIKRVNALIKAGADVNITHIDGIEALALVIKHNGPERCMALINPAVVKPSTKKKIAILLMIYNEGTSYLSALPQELLKIIIQFADPEEFAMDQELIHYLHPKALVDTIPLKTLAILIKDGTLNQDSILDAWQKKLASIIWHLKIYGGYLNYNDIQKFESYTSKEIKALLTQ